MTVTRFVTGDIDSDCSECFLADLKSIPEKCGSFVLPGGISCDVSVTKLRDNCHDID